MNDNNGYGRAVNNLISLIDTLPKYICILNTDVSWLADPFSLMVNWFNINTEVVLAVPAIHDLHGNIQKLCKRIQLFWVYLVDDLCLIDLSLSGF